MKLITFGVAAALMVGSIGLACATPVNLINNGDFSQTSPGQTAPVQFNGSSGTCGITGNNNWGGEFVTGWQTNGGGYAVWYPSATAASTEQACTRYGNTGKQLLPGLVTAPPSGVGTFVGLDGQEGLNTYITQTINNLAYGHQYTVKFDWASTQEMSRTGATTERFKVSLGNQSFLTSINSIGTHGWSGWTTDSFTFTAGGPSAVLEFLSIGTPASLPPFALLANVSMTAAVPEPPALAMFGLGLLGLGVVTVASRRRARRRGSNA